MTNSTVIAIARYGSSILALTAGFILVKSVHTA